MYGHVITKFSRMDRFSSLWGSARARAWSSANMKLELNLNIES